MLARRICGGAFVAGAVAAASYVGGAATATGLPRTTGATHGYCATLRLTATPKVNAQNAPYETLRNEVKSCDSTTETVTLVQTLAGPFVRGDSHRPTRTWKFRLSPGTALVKVQHIPYSCCGTYSITDRVYSVRHRQLAHATASFTFA